MLSEIRRFFDSYLKQDGEDSSPDQRERRIQLASAALMIELSRSDHDIEEDERRTLVKLLRQRFDLSPERLEELVQLAETEAREAVSLYQFTSLLNEEFNYADKVELIRHLWQIAYADGRIDRYEEHMIRKVAELMYISHADFIRCKLEVRDGEV